MNFGIIVRQNSISL